MSIRSVNSIDITLLQVKLRLEWTAALVVFTLSFSRVHCRTALQLTEEGLK
jgi:hypothetical protein